MHLLHRPISSSLFTRAERSEYLVQLLAKCASSHKMHFSWRAASILVGVVNCAGALLVDGKCEDDGAVVW